MIKIGIMSMHRIFNYGSFLQGYGLKQILNSCGSENQVAFLDYRKGAPLIKSPQDNSTGLSRIAAKVAEYAHVRAPLRDKVRFFNHKRTYARKYFGLLGLSAAPNFDFNVDLQVIGSDEVFNCVQANANVGYSRDLFGHASPARRVVSYAGSFGNTTLEKIRKYGLERDLAADLLRFSDVSVRDENSHDIVKALTGIEPTVSVDPVLAYDYMKDCPHIPAGRMLDRPYLIVYGYPGRISDEESDAIRRYARARQLEVVCIGGIQACCDRFVDCSPFEVLALFRDAAAIVTDTFHGTIFSIINEKNFLTIVRRSQGEAYGNEEKLGYLLSSLGLREQGVFELSDASIEEVLSGQIDFTVTRSTLERARRDAYMYALRNVEAACA